MEQGENSLTCTAPIPALVLGPYEKERGHKNVLNALQSFPNNRTGANSLTCTTPVPLRLTNLH